jgi:hypothetical protein
LFQFINSHYISYSKKNREIDKTVNRVLKTMNSPNNQDWEQRLKDLEQEIDRTTSPESAEHTETVRPHVEIDPSQKITAWLNSARDWFNNLPTAGRVIVGVGAIAIGFSVLNVFLRLISSLISIAILGGLLYLGYKFLVTSSKSE